jgi:AraC family L-rhamnose operon transcriptional activator RhaR/AraC family L-rhamnose operon regulatory protein RhaS
MNNIARAKSHFKRGLPPLALVWIRQQDNIPLHQHNFHELVIILSGKGVHSTDTESYPIQAGDVFLVRPGTAHGYHDTAGLELANILYLPDQLHLPEFDLPDTPGYHAFFELEPALRRQHRFKSRLTVPRDTLGTLRQLVLQLETELADPQPGSGHIACACFMQIKGIIARSYSSKESPQATTLLRIGQLLSFIERNYAVELTLDQLAEQASMSKSTLNRTFHKILRMSPVNYLISTRIAKATGLLRDPNARVTDVAFEVGFTDSNYFSRQFKKVTGISPLKYKQRTRPLKYKRNL